MKFTLTFSGHLHSVDGASAERAAGAYREDITFEGSTRKCTTNGQPFYATRDAQPAQTSAAPPPGAYTGAILGDSKDLTFEVSSDSKHLLNIRVPSTSLQCTGEGAITSTGDIDITDATVSKKRAFKTVVTSKGTILNAPVVFTFTFNGHFHSENKEFVERAAGTYREDISYEGATRRCTTNSQAWSATHN